MVGKINYKCVNKQGTYQCSEWAVGNSRQWEVFKLWGSRLRSTTLDWKMFCLTNFLQSPKTWILKSMFFNLGWAIIFRLLLNFISTYQSSHATSWLQRSRAHSNFECSNNKSVSSNSTCLCVCVFYVSRGREGHTAVLFNDAVNCQDFETRYGDRWKNMSVDHSWKDNDRRKSKYSR
jgi:hypothetical protein